MRTELRVLRVSRPAAVVVRVTIDESGAEVSIVGKVGRILDVY